MFSCLLIRLPLVKAFFSGDHLSSLNSLNGQNSHFIHSHHELFWYSFTKYLNELLCSFDNSETSYSFVKVSFIFGMIFTYPNLTDIVIVGFGIHCCVTLAHTFIHVLCFKEFPLAITAFQHNFAFKYGFTPKYKIYCYKGTRSMYFDAFQDNELSAL